MFDRVGGAIAVSAGLFLGFYVVAMLLGSDVRDNVDAIVCGGVLRFLSTPSRTGGE